MGGGHGHGVTYKGVTLHQPKRWHSVTGKGLCAVMWFWVLYRAKQDGPVVLVRYDVYQSSKLWAGGTLGKVMMITTRKMMFPMTLEH
ncbi:UNVERIFIED_CONTAM: NADH dehydrogenase [ubiquinone] 1 beta subcomplex subunit [Sesamum calycinum]|uniref:NADH dehydrogenase [ubiquinone] 1 beta subcomplex subunit n=2 Tax=Sesamum TaxID=4181 RepID=A0AAE1WCQ1_9LAMI|nr:NADH dehydrogenase [ubiquinone] 1 beta subcomplex subunit [Sesamum angolense]